MVCLLAVPGSAQNPNQDPGFRAWLWLEAARTRDPALAKALNALSITGISAEPTEDFARLDDLGIPYYLDQIMRGGFLAIDKKTFDEALRQEGATANQRPRCLAEPETLSAGDALITKVLARLGKSRPAFVSLRDEPSFTRLINPADWCHAPASLHAFARFVRDRWGTADRIRQAWGLPKDAPLGPPGEASNPSPTALTPPSTSAIRDGLFHTGPTTRGLVAWNDARAFADLVFARSVKRWCDHGRATAAGLDVGILGGQMPHAFGGFDWEQLLPSLDVVEAYDYGGAREILRSLAAPQTRILQTVLPRPGEPAIASVHDAWSGFFHGTRELVLYSGDAVFQGKDASKPSAWARALAPALARMSGPKLAAWRRAREIPAQVAILTSMPSVRLQWLFDTRHDGVGWQRRLTSYALSHSTQARTRQSWIALLEDLGLRYVFVTPRQIQAGALSRSSLRALVLPRSIALSSAETARIRKFLDRGGLVVADAQTGLYTGRLARRSIGALDTAFGIRRKDRRTNLAGDKIRKSAARVGNWPIAEPGLLGAGAVPLHTAGGVPCLLTGHPSGGLRGRTLYLNLLLLSYAEARLERPNDAAWLRKELRPHFQHAGLRPIVDLDRREGEPTWPVEIHARRDGTDLLVALHLSLRSGAVPVPWSSVAKTPRIALTVHLAGTFAVSEITSNRSLGRHNSVEVEIAVDAPVILRLSR